MVLFHLVCPTPGRGTLRRANQVKRSGQRVRLASRGRERARWLLVAVGLAVVLWATAQVLGAPLWSKAVLAGRAAAVSLIVTELRSWFGQGDTRAGLVEQRVAVSGERRRLLPRV